MKPIINLGLPYSYIAVALRLVNVVVGAIGLIVTRRLLRTMGLSEAVAVLTVIMLIGRAATSGSRQPSATTPRR